MILQLILASLGLATAVFMWWAKNDADKKKEIEDEDAKIDAANSITDFVHIDDELRERK